MKNPRKKKTKPKKVEQKKGGGVVENENKKEDERKRRVLEALIEAFSLSSIEEAARAYDVAGGDPDKASQILRKGFGDNVEYPFCSSSSMLSGGSSGVSSASTSGSSDGFVEQTYGEDVRYFKGGRQKKKVVASTGTVSTVLGKDYVRRNGTRNNGFNTNGVVVDKEEAEQFLCSMLGNDSDLSLAVVRDVLCQCGYNIEKASNILLDLAASTVGQSSSDRHPNYRVDNIDDERFLVDPNDSLTDRRSECTSLSSESELSDNQWSLVSLDRNYAEVLSSSKANSAISPGCTRSEIPQKVLESLFNIPKITEHNKDAMNWRRVAKKMQSLGPGFDIFPPVTESQQRIYAKGDEYQVFREDSNQHWNSVKSYYQKAATAFTKGDRAYAAYLSDQGKEQTKLAQKADTKASHDIFVARNKGIENVITIDLHGQHVKPAMRMLKLHLLFGYVPSVQVLRVITGCGSHGVGKSKLKQTIERQLNGVKRTVELC
ncbi:SMR domain-containing protein At5g58720 isoform X2 [Abrus precatorius]|uniref:SMR domain-containing protein At5g58720 isoform X2 n=1 Tax=Abrus precatorius TaxID=3816 RepID=A0A8B8JTP0_ABRPR|nr:SMR domain-containing protein At5g58720 isoform X2 [Abrus precatorius]